MLSALKSEVIDVGDVLNAIDAWLCFIFMTISMTSALLDVVNAAPCS
jgi:hypothetical protein